MILTAAVLCALLGHQTFAIRESAHESLEKLGLLALPALSVALENRDPEVASRASRLLAKLKIETDPTSLWLGSFIALPYCDSLSGFCEFLGEARRQLFERGIEDHLWLDYRLALRLYMDNNGPIDLTTLNLMMARSRFWDSCGRYP